MSVAAARVAVNVPPANNYPGTQNPSVDFYNSPTATIQSSGSYDPAQSGAQEINIIGSFTLTIVTANLTTNLGIKILASGGVPAVVCADNGALILGASSLVVKPGPPVGLLWNGSAFVAW